VPHPLVVAVYSGSSAAAAGARALHALGITRDQISVVTRSHDEEGALAHQMDASPGAEIEDSRKAAVLGELSGLVLAAIALVLPGIGALVAAGPLSAGLGDAAGHVAGSIASVLAAAGVADEQANEIARRVEEGAVLLAVHVDAHDVTGVRDALASTGATKIEVANWYAGD
jgi:hypothetical protein